MEAGVAVIAIMQRMSLSLQAGLEVANINGLNLSNVDGFIQLEDKEIGTLCRVIRR